MRHQAPPRRPPTATPPKAATRLPPKPAPRHPMRPRLSNCRRRNLRSLCPSHNPILFQRMGLWLGLFMIHVQQLIFHAGDAILWAEAVLRGRVGAAIEDAVGVGASRIGQL